MTSRRAPTSTWRGPLPVWRRATLVCTAVLAASAASGRDGSLGMGEPGASTLVIGASERTVLERTPREMALGSDAASPGPTLHPLLSKRVKAKLHGAIPVAVKHLRNYRRCQGLFDRLGANGIAKINATSYYPAGAKQERRYCRGGSQAITTVGGSDVVLCRSFGRLSNQQAALILIHEALHFAGQSEYPLDASAPNGVAISRMVMRSCRL